MTDEDPFRDARDAVAKALRGVLGDVFMPPSAPKRGKDEADIIAKDEEIARLNRQQDELLQALLKKDVQLEEAMENARWVRRIADGYQRSADLCANCGQRRDQHAATGVFNDEPWCPKLHQVEFSKTKCFVAGPRLEDHPSIKRLREGKVGGDDNSED